MTSRHSDTVGIAFEMLLEAIDKEIRSIVTEGMRAFEAQDFGSVTRASNQAERYQSFRKRVMAISEEWKAIASGKNTTERRSEAFSLRQRRNWISRSRLRNSVKGYYIPILQALDELGGSGQTRVVVERMYRLMERRLGPDDHEPLPSKPHIQRWRYMAQMARSAMARKGLLNPDSPRGIWEITEEGRAYLRQHASEDSSDNNS